MKKTKLCSENSNRVFIPQNSVTSQTKQMFLCARITALVMFACALALPFAMAKDKSDKAKDDKVKNSVYAELAKVPAKDAAKQNPYEKDPDAIAAGQKIFGLHCAECHGANGDGAHKGPSLRAEQVQQTTAGSLFWVLTNGEVRKGMPVWSKLPEAQRWQIVSYMKSLTPSAKPQAALTIPVVTQGEVNSFARGAR
jgi:mono/diheme cytochrome c family protein